MAKKILKVAAAVGHASRLLPIGASLVCANTRAKKLRIMGVYGLQGTKRRLRSAGVGSVVKVTVTKGPQQMKHKMYHALVIRQKAPYTRYDTGKIAFEDNAAVIVDDQRKLMKGVIRGVVARQVTKNPLYSEIAGNVV